MAGLRMGRNWRRSELLGLTSLNEGSQWRGPESSARNGRNWRSREHPRVRFVRGLPEFGALGAIDGVHLEGTMRSDEQGTKQVSRSITCRLMKQRLKKS